MTDTYTARVQRLREHPELELPTVDLTAAAPTSTPLQRLIAIARRHGPFFVQRFHDRETAFVTSLDLVEELSDETRFAKAVGPALRSVRDITADGLFTAYNDEPNWAKAHDILLPAFALGSMRTYHPTMLRVARRLLSSWDRHLAESTPVDVAQDMTRMTLDTIGLSGFGYDFESFRRTDPHPFVQALVRALAHSQESLARVPGKDYSAQDAAFRADAAFLAEVVDEVIGKRQADGDSSADDLLGLMLGSPHPVSGELLDEANIRNQVITFLIAGHETTSGTLSFALYHLMKHPVALHLAQAEVDALWGDTADPEPSFEDIGKLRYVRQILNETLRLWPTAAAFQREARADTVIGGRYPIRAGQSMVVLTPVLHRDPAWGDNVEEFDPDRFTPQVEAERSPNAFKPFGTGERACIGRQFALHEATMLLGLLIHRYRFLDHAGYQLRVKETLTLKPEGFTLALAPRTAQDRQRNRASRTVAPGTSAASAATDDAGLPSRVTPGTALTVLYGSNFGTCRSFAAQLAEAADDLGCDVTLAALNDHTAALPTDSPVAIVAASYNGRPTDDADAFVSWLAQAAPGAADGVHFAVLGVGDRNWAATYQRVPTVIDDRLAALGGTRLTARAEADASGDLAGSVDRFRAALCRTLLERHGDPDAASASDGDAADHRFEVTEIVGTPTDALAERHGMTAMTVVETGDLADLGHPLGRSKRFVRIALPDGVDYRTADHLTVLPENAPAQVERALRLLRVEPDTVLNIRAHRPNRSALPVDRPVSVSELLSRHVELQDPPTARQLAVLAERDPCPPEQASLRRLAADGGAGGLLDVIEDHPALQGLLDWPVLLELLPPMRPRHYSISSSPATDPAHADLMVSLLSAPARSGHGTFQGVGSSYLHRVGPGATVYARVQPCREAFRIGNGPSTPVIMVSAGTGLAPFRGAIADRLALLGQGAALAPALCYFGCDHPDVDYLHRSELEDAQAKGAVAMRPAFSGAPQGGRPFVQDRITAEADEVWALLESGAEVYVCGDGARMAPGVRAAFQRIYADRTGVDAVAAERWWQEMVDGGRYVEDVYASR